MRCSTGYFSFALSYLLPSLPSSVLCPQRSTSMDHIGGIPCFLVLHWVWQLKIKKLESGMGINFIVSGQVLVASLLLKTPDPFCHIPPTTFLSIFRDYSLSVPFRSRDSNGSLLLLVLRCCALYCFPNPALTFIVSLLIKLSSITHFEYTICFLLGLWLVHVGTFISWLYESRAHRG